MPEGYTAVDANPVTIPFENGAATQTDVTFTYAAPVIPTEGTVTFRFVDGQGNPLRDAVQTTVANGVYTDLSVYQAAIDGYDCIGVSTNQLTVENGVASPAEVIFTYQRKPVNGKVRVVYMADGVEFSNEERQLTVLGENTVSPGRQSGALRLHRAGCGSCDRHPVRRRLRGAPDCDLYL